jgi:hypothetical protein
LDIKLLHVSIFFFNAGVVGEELFTSGINSFFQRGVHGHWCLPVFQKVSGKE